MPTEHSRLPREFYAMPALDVARQALGKNLVHVSAGQRVAGVIVETEAYVGQEDLGCHARAGLTSRNRTMFGPPGHAYVYFTYGMHWMLNLVTEAEGSPSAVLVRAVEPSEGLDFIASRRAGKAPAIWTDGPAKLTQALGIDGSYNGHDLCSPEARLFLEEGPSVPEEAVQRTARIGLNNVPEPWKSIPWRFYVSPQYRT